MKQNKTVKYAYAAGFFDGDGCIRLPYRYRKKQKRNYYVQILISQKDGKIIDWFYGNFGGIIYFNKRQSKTDGIYNGMHNWILTNKKATEFLKKIYPFLKGKKKQAELAIRMQSRIDNTPKNTEIRTGKFKSLSDNELKIREDISQKIKDEKSKITKSKKINKEYLIEFSAGAETKREYSSIIEEKL